MSKYLAVFKTSFQEALQYRLEFALSNIGWAIRLLISILLWTAIAAKTGGIGGYTLNNIIVYFVLVQIITGFLFSRAVFDIVEDIRTGDFSNYLVKPISYLFYRLTEEFSKNIVRAIIGFVIFGSLLFALEPDVIRLFTPLKLLVWIPSLVFAYLISFLIVVIIALTGFWVINANRFAFIYFGILHLLSGLIVPIDLFPPALENIVMKSPFPYIFYAPAKFVLIEGFTEFHWQSLFMQGFYIVLFTVIAVGIYRLGIKHYEAVGR